MDKEIELKIKIKEEDKEKMEDVCSSCSISLDDAFRLFIKKVINDQSLPFDITSDITDEDELYNHDDIWL